MSRASTERRVGPPERRAAAARLPSRSAVRALRQFLNARRDGWVLETRLMLAACMLASEARRCGLPPERLLVALKRTWRALDEVRHLPALDAQAALSRLVTLTIQAYYEPRRAGGAPEGAHGSDGARAAI